MDVSTGEPEAEFMHRKHFKPDSEKYARMVDDVTRLDGWERLNGLVRDAVELQHYYAQNMALHVKILKKLDRKLSQRTLKSE